MRRLVTWLSLVAISSVAALPFLPIAPPRSIDGLLHLYRLVELDRCLSQGAFYPRWAPDLAQGYGFPLFHYYPPLSYYLAEAWHLLGFSLARALSLTYMTAAALSTAGMYLLAKEWAGEAGGVVAALLYTNAPFTLQNAVRRGGLAEVLAWAIAPLVLWTFRRLAHSWRARYLVGASLSFGAFILAHHLSLLTLGPLLALLVIGTALEARSWRVLLRPLPALMLGAGLSAFFAVPAYLERGLVQIDRVYASAGFDYHYFFEPLRSLLSGPVSIDVSLLNAPVPRSIGWIQAGVALSGAVAALVARCGKRGWYVGGLLVALALLAMTQLVSVRVWELFSILRYLQFPWRLLAPLCLVLAFTGSGIAVLAGERRRWAAPALVIAVALGLYLYNTPLLYTGQHPIPSPNPTVADLLEFERSYWLPSLTSNYDYLPIWVRELPGESPMAAQYAASSAVTWLDRRSLPAGTELLEETYGLNDMRFRIIAPEPCRVVVNQFYFPGWRAYVESGLPVEK
ncbi:MAG: glycosyltransferase family 39 protein [Anaerolineae bacterium]|nr:glycosyltransferase family 39 protein [Anaerolineae bacterium]